MGRFLKRALIEMQLRDDKHLPIHYAIQLQILAGSAQQRYSANFAIWPFSRGSSQTLMEKAPRGVSSFSLPFRMFTCVAALLHACTSWA